jgi:hypothetical protein
MTEEEARTALRAFDGTGGLEQWLAEQVWQVEPDGWTVPLDLSGWRFRLQPIPAGLWVNAIPPGGGAPAVWVVPGQ